jgi:hypothetical protein
MQGGTTGSQNPVSQSTGAVDVNAIYAAAPLNRRKDTILKHNIFIDKTLIIVFLIVLVSGFLIARYDADAGAKTTGSVMAGSAIGALANRMKSGNLSPD